MMIGGRKWKQQQERNKAELEKKLAQRLAPHPYKHESDEVKALAQKLDAARLEVSVAEQAMVRALVELGKAEGEADFWKAKAIELGWEPDNSADLAEAMLTND